MSGPDLVTTLLASAINPRENPFVFLAAFGCLCGIYLFAEGILLLRRKRRLRANPVTAIRDASSGLLEVSGAAEGQQTLSAAISGKPCFYYRAIVWRQQDSTQSDSWNKVAEETMCRTFLLNDQTGRLLVDPRGANIDIPRDTYEEYGKTLLSTHTDISVGLEDFLVRHKVDRRAALRVEEYLIPPAAQIFIYGTATRNLTLDATGAPLAPAKRSSSAAANMAAPGAGVLQTTEKPSALPSASPVLIGKGAAASASLETVSGHAQPQIIRLSPEPRNTPAAEMTMQSRLAAALARARMTNSEAEPTAAPETSPAAVVAVEEQVEQQKKPEEAPPPLPALPLAPEPPVSEPSASEPLPPFLLRQGKNGSPFSISSRARDEISTSPSGMAIAFVVVGPLVTLASTYYLLLKFGWL